MVKMALKAGANKNAETGQFGMYLTIAVISAICYYNSCYCDFVFDDLSAIKDNKDLRPHTPISNIFFDDFWGTPMNKEQSHKSYRPLCVLTFRLNYLLHQLNPMGYHFVNVVLHIIVSLLYFRTCSVFLSDTSSFIAAVSFSVHPIHTEAVTGVVGRAETLSSVFFLLSFMFYIESSQVRNQIGWKALLLSMVSMGTAMLCKEQGITVAGVCLLYEIFLVQKMRIKDMMQNMKWTTKFHPNSMKRLMVLFSTTVTLLMVRLHVMGSTLPVFTRHDNPASVSEWPARYMTYNYLVSVNLWLLLFPCDLCCDWTMGTIPLVENITDKRNIATLVSYFVIFVLIYVATVSENRRQTNTIIIGLGLLVLPFLPASNLFFPVGFVVAERVLYMPSMGFCMLVAYGFGLMMEKRNGKFICIGLLSIMFISHGLKTHIRNNDWKNEYSIFMSGLKVNQRNAKLFNNVGHALENQGRYEEALQYFNKAVSIQEDDIGAHINVGRTFNHLKKFEEAEKAYLKAKALLPKVKPGESYQARIAPNHLNVFINLANLISKNATRLEEADMLYRQAISMRSDYIQAYINRGDLLLKLNKTKEAQEVYERALFYDRSNPNIYYNLAVVLLEQGKTSQGLAYLDKTLEFDPNHKEALLNSAIILQELKAQQPRRVAKERLLRLLQSDHENERAYFNLGMMAMDENDPKSAEEWFRKSIMIKEDFRSALFNLALLLADDGRPLEATPFLNQLIRHHSNHINGLILLGDIYINHIKDLDAAENCYKKILEMEPNNTQGMHNLCVVLVERGELEKAEKCLQTAHNLAPKEDYILRHLQIVRGKIRNAKLPMDKMENDNELRNKLANETEKDKRLPKTEKMDSRNKPSSLS